MNYIQLKRKIPSRYARYLFVDDKKGSAGSVFYRNKLNVRIGDIAKRENDKYQLVFCEVHKKDSPKFEKVMKELANKMYILGNNDYDKFCKDIFYQLTGDEV